MPVGNLAKSRELQNLCKSEVCTRTRFYKQPFKFVKDLFTKKKSRTLKTPKLELEEHLEKVHSDTKRKHKQLVIPHYIFNLLLNSTWRLALQNGKKQRIQYGAQDQHGVPYKLYKNVPDVLRYLWRLMRIVWQKEMIPKVWRRAGGVLIPKGKDAADISQFGPICLLNVEGKIFFSVIAQRLSTNMVKNKYIDTSVQKAWGPGFSGFLEHTSMIWH